MIVYGSNLRQTVIFSTYPYLPLAVLDAVPNPILVKDAQINYLWVNAAFERLFNVSQAELVGKSDKEVFPSRQAAQCNAGDLRVLADGVTDEATETVLDPDLGQREIITRKSRLTVEGQHFLVGVLHDITDITVTNRQLAKAGLQLEEQAAELRRLASTDSLTGCLNRRAFFQSTKYYESPCAGLMILDLDEFKGINDAHGHLVGDLVLVHFVKILRSILRSDDEIARVGGEEFAVLLPALPESAVRDLAERIRKAIEDSQAVGNDVKVRYTVSIGVAFKNQLDSDPIEDLMDLADQRLYQAKAAGRNQVVVGE